MKTGLWQRNNRLATWISSCVCHIAGLHSEGSKFFNSVGFGIQNGLNKKWPCEYGEKDFILLWLI